MAFAPALPLIALLIAVFLMMVAKSWDTSFGPLLRYIADRLDNLTIRLPRAPDIHLPALGGVFRAADKYVRAALSAAIAFTVEPFLVFIRYMADVLTAPALAASELAADVLHTVGDLRRRIVPALIAASGATLLVEAVRRSVAVVLPRLGRAERDLAGALDRIGSLARRLTPAAVLAATAVAVGRLGFGWVRCGRVGRVGRRLCGMDDSALDALLAGTILMVGSYSLVQFAEEMQDATEEIAPLVRRFWRAA